MIENEHRFGLTQIQMVSVARAQFDCVATSEDNEVVKNFVGRRICWEKFENERSCNLRFGSHLTIGRTRLPICGVIPLLRTSLTFEDVRPTSRGSDLVELIP